MKFPPQLIEQLWGNRKLPHTFVCSKSRSNEIFPRWKIYLKNCPIFDVTILTRISCEKLPFWFLSLGVEYNFSDVEGPAFTGFFDSKIFLLFPTDWMLGIFALEKLAVFQWLYTKFPDVSQFVLVKKVLVFICLPSRPRKLGPITCLRIGWWNAISENAEKLAAFYSVVLEARQEQ